MDADAEKVVIISMVLVLLMLVCMGLSLFPKTEVVEGKVIDRWQLGWYLSRSSAQHYVSIRVEGELRVYLVPDSDFWSALEVGEEIHGETYCTPACCQCLVEVNDVSGID
jgi:hypothetical protein